MSTAADSRKSISVCPTFSENPIVFCTPRQTSSLLSEGRKLIMFVRHGLTDWNMEMRLQGRNDIPLNSLGNEQALALAETFCEAASLGLVIGQIFSSPLSRAAETARHISRRLSGSEPIILESLIERDYSTLSGMTPEMRKAKFPSPKYYPCDIESVPDSAARMKKTAMHIYRSTEDGNAVAVSHGGVINALFSYLTGGRSGTSKNISCNCTISAVAAGSADIIPLTFNMDRDSFIAYVKELIP